MQVFKNKKEAESKLAAIYNYKFTLIQESSKLTG